MIYDVHQRKNHDGVYYEASARTCYHPGRLNTQYDTTDINGNAIGHWVSVEATSSEEAIAKAKPIFTNDYWYDDMGKIMIFKPSHRKSREFMDFLKGNKI